MATARRSSPKKKSAPRRKSTASRRTRPNSSRKEYEVIVGNIGRVYDGTNGKEARDTYAEYVAQSASGRGRAGGESVTLFCDGDILMEHVGEEDQDDSDY